MKICIETFDDEAGYVAWIDSAKFKGIVVQASTLKGVLEELLTSVNVKIATDYGIAVGGVDAKVKELMEDETLECEGEKELKLVFA